MGLFGKKDPGKLQGNANASQAFLRDTFGLTRVPGAGYSVQGASNMTAEVRDPATGLQLIKELRETMPFTFVCVLAAQQTCFVCGSKPPFAVMTGLDTTGGADLISLIAQDSGSKIVELEGAWVLTLS